MELIISLTLKYEKKEENDLEIVYNVKYRFKTNVNETDDELKKIINNKLLNVIMILENQPSAFKES